MAAREKKTNLTERDGVLGVIISRDEFKEYENLKADRDISEASMRARMQENNQNALNLARVIEKIFDRVGFEKVAELLGKSVAEDLLDRAYEILATE